jgi:hypothetical protein
VQGRCTFLQNLALRAIAKQPINPAAGLGGATVCTTTLVCTKKGHKARWREGDKCFFSSFFLGRTISLVSGDNHCACLSKQSYQSTAKTAIFVGLYNRPALHKTGKEGFSTTSLARRCDSLPNKPCVLNLEMRAISLVWYGGMTHQISEQPLTVEILQLIAKFSYIAPVNAPSTAGFLHVNRIFCK